MTQEEQEGDVSPGLFFLDNLIQKVKTLESGILLGSFKLPENSDNKNIFSIYVNNPGDSEILNWGQWGLSEEEENSGGYGKHEQGVFMPTIKTEKDGYLIHLGITGFTSKELYYHVAKIK